MAIYSELTDYNDPALVIEERHTTKADVYVEMQLAVKAIAPADLSALLPIALLTEIAVAWGCRLAAVEQAIGENSPLLSKAREYEKIAIALSNSITRPALGLTEPVNSGYGFCTMGRG
jgi:hypothetical protein